jgi:Lrp/AsnC family transcriptional regulator, leucine-responsive regulatory protein
MKTFDRSHALDDVGQQLIAALQENARLSFSELGRLVGLSAPAVAERVRRLEEGGVITGYHASVDPAALGLSIAAFIRLSTSGDRGEGGRLPPLVRALPEVLECYGITGTDSFLLKVAVESVPHLGRLLQQLEPFGQLNTSIILTTFVGRRTLTPAVTDERSA